MNLSPSPNSRTSRRWPGRPRRPRFARGYALVILPATSRHDVWSNVALDGTVVIDPSDHDPVVTELVRQGLPVVSDGRPAGTLPVTAWVDNDHEAAVLDLLDHLAAAGARRIGLLTGTSTDTYTRLSTTAYLDWCARVGQSPSTRPIRRTTRARAPSRPTGCSPARTGPTPCTASSTPTGPTSRGRAPLRAARPGRPPAGLLQRVGRLRHHRTAPHDALAQTAPDRHGGRPAPHRRHRGGRERRTGRAGHTDRTHRPHLLAAPPAPHDGQPAALAREGLIRGPAPGEERLRTRRSRPCPWAERPNRSPHRFQPWTGPSQFGRNDW